MTRFAESYAVWLADYYLLATVLLGAGVDRHRLTEAAGPAADGHEIHARRVGAAGDSLRSARLVGRTFAGRRTAATPVSNRCAKNPCRIPMLVAATRSDTKAIPFSERSHRAVLPTNCQMKTYRNRSQPKMSWSALLATAHLAGMACIVAWLALGWVASLRLRRTAQPAPANVSAILNELASLDSLGSSASQLFTHDRIDVAVALGVWRPMILLPDRWTKQPIATTAASRIWRTNRRTSSTTICNGSPLARVLFVALWANPLFWLTKRRLRLDQEALADAAAAEITSRQQYAEQLVAWARDARSRPALHLSSAVGLWEGPSQLRQRIAILLDEQLTVLRNCSRRWRLASIALGALVATALSLITLRPGETAPVETEKQTVSDSTPPQPVPNVANGRVLNDKNLPIAGADVFLFRVNQRDGTLRAYCPESHGRRWAVPLRQRDRYRQGISGQKISGLLRNWRRDAPRHRSPHRSR